MDKPQVTSIPLFTLIFGFRDREPERVRRCMDSLARQTFTDFEVIFVDYGSSTATRAQVQPLVESYPFCRYIYTETRGRPWNRAAALNIGARQARGAYICTSDIDMIFSANFCETVNIQSDPNRLLLCVCHWLPKDFDNWQHVEQYWRQIDTSNREYALGGLQGIPALVYQKLGGFDEFYRYYGREDNDFYARLTSSGLIPYWIDEHAAMFHQWHPESGGMRDVGDMPGIDQRDLVVRWDALLYDQQQRAVLVRNGQDWGRVLQADDRPVFDFVDPDQGTLRHSEQLVLFDLPYYPLYAVRRLVDAFWDLPSGHALAVHQADQPRRSRRADQVITWVNRYLLKRLDTAADYRMNRLHAFIAYFILQEENGMIADYYLDLNGVTILVKA